MRRWLVLAAATLALAGCGQGEPVVASKAFTESVILAEIAVQRMRIEGLKVEHKDQLGGSALLFRGLETGDVDAYPEYTGTLTGELLADEYIEGEPELRAALERRGILMTRALGFNNTYALGMKRARAEALGITKISDLRGHPDLAFGFTNEFVDRADGWPKVRDAYGLPQTNVTGLEHSLTYPAMDEGQIDVTDLYSTDAQITYHDLVVLEDDRHVFPRYDAVFLYRKDAAERCPAFVAALKSLEGRIDEARMIAMNVEAKPPGGQKGEPEAVIASEFLREEGFTSTPEVMTLRQRVWLRTRQHFLLVTVSMILAILIGVPLGILAFKRPFAGQGILLGVGAAQTIPSLALLFLVFPIFGIGNDAAIAALVLYSLLPILRSTHAGLTGIAGPLQESAEVLGLRPTTKLLRIEVPLASRSILAGIKTASVINVGFAMLGAFIGAGGYGQPIMTGIRNMDMARIWEGVVPSMVMAFVVALVFEAIERMVVPRGLRLVRH